MNQNFTILKFDEVTSTNDLAFDLAKESKAWHHFIIVADTQTKGRGRQDRIWQSGKGNLYFSLILQPEVTDFISNYSFLTACVLGDVLSFYGIKTQYKWPNDIILNDKKLSGILLQLQKINKVNNLVIGVGVNLITCPEYAISLINHNINAEDFLGKFCDIFFDYEEKYKQFGFAFIRQKWKKNAYKIGESIKLSNGMDGIFQDIDANGNILLFDASEKIHVIAAEEIVG